MKKKTTPLKALLVYSIYCLFSSFAYSQLAPLQHVEPPNWWTNMEQHELEIMLHGKNIATATVEVEGLTVLGIKKTENPNYIFVTVETKNAKAGTYPIHLKQNGKIKLTVPYTLNERRQGSKDRLGYTPSDVIYLLMPDRFANGNTANDSHPQTIEKANRNLPGGRHGGDIQGIVDHLDYIKALGATAIWSTPLLEDNDSTYSYHTYGQSDFYKIDPRYGTNEDYKNLVREAHNKNLKIIMDVVPNHCGASHWMMNDLPTYTWVHQFPGYKQTSYRASTQMDPNTAAADLKLCADGWFVRSMPDLNQSNPLVLNYLVQNTIWWMEYADVDALRVDTYIYNDKAGIAEWTRKIMQEYPKTNIVGEVWLHNQAQISYWQKDSPIAAIQHYNTYLPSVMDFTLHDAMLKAFGEKKQDWDKGVVRFYENMVNDFMYANPNNLLVFAENHDTPRFNELYHSINDYKLVMTLIATVRGTPTLYYGSEIGMAGNKDKGDADIRRDFPGGWKEDARNAFTVVGRTQEQDAYYVFTQKLFNWRKTSSAVTTGKTIQFIPENNVFTYFRIDGDKVVMVVLNNSEKEETIDLNRFDEVIKDFTSAEDILSGKTITSKSSFSLSGKTPAIFEWKK